jgi:hypothetical protein
MGPVTQIPRVRVNPCYSLHEMLGNVSSNRDTGITFHESIHKLRCKLSGFDLELLVLGTLLGKDGSLCESDQVILLIIMIDLPFLDLC